MLGPRLKYLIIEFIPNIYISRRFLHLLPSIPQTSHLKSPYLLLLMNIQSNSTLNVSKKRKKEKFTSYCSFAILSAGFWKNSDEPCMQMRSFSHFSSSSFSFFFLVSYFQIHRTIGLQPRLIHLRSL